MKKELKKGNAQKERKEQDPARFNDPKNYVNRELSWLEFDCRVLEEARDKTTPLFDRLKFLSITASNLDEFFMVRVASLKDMVHAGYKKPDIAGMTASEQLEKISVRTHELVTQQYNTYNRSLLPALRSIGLNLIENHEDLTPEQGEFVDLCAGPHIMYTKGVKAFKLTSIAGAYWRGSEKNKMLTRIYGTAFANKTDLESYLTMMEEAKKRDHRKLGKELGLFMMADEGPGFPFFLPKGMTLKNTLLDYWRQVHKKYGYVEISTPIMLNRQLWERSGHWDHYKNNMYTTVIDDVDFAVKPMNCPGGMLVYASQPHSYKELPLRVGEIGLVHRHELSGALHGLFRVRCFNQDDAHVFMTRDQMQDVIQETVRLFDEVYSVFGLSYTIELSTMPEDHIGTVEEWERNQDILKAAITDMGKDFIINEGDGAFYGPKLDFHLADSLGRTWQCGTIQLDSQLPERFELEYTGEDGQKHRPVMIHRVVLGSIERFIGVITEHFAGAFPAWLSPVQVKVLPVTDRASDYADQISKALDQLGFRVEVDHRNEKIGKKIREATMEKVPYMLVVGDRDMENGTVSVRHRSGEDLGAMSLDAFAQLLGEEVRTKAIK